MTKEELQILYKDKIIPENKTPYHFEKKDTADWEVAAYNPMCGDKYQLQLDLEGEKISQAHFHGIGCAISRASTSILLKKVEGKSQEEVRILVKRFLDSIKSDDVASFDEEELNVLVELKNFDGRVDCITLSWEGLWRELEKKTK